MTDLLLLAGIALCILSVPLAVIGLLRTEPPRAAAAVLLLGFILIGLGAWFSPDGFTVRDIGHAWQRLVEGRLF